MTCSRQQMRIQMVCAFTHSASVVDCSCGWALTIGSRKADVQGIGRQALVEANGCDIQHGIGCMQKVLFYGGMHAWHTIMARHSTWWSPCNICSIHEGSLFSTGKSKLLQESSQAHHSIAEKRDRTANLLQFPCKAVTIILHVMAGASPAARSFAPFIVLQSMGRFAKAPVTSEAIKEYSAGPHRLPR